MKIKKLNFTIYSARFRHISKHNLNPKPITIIIIIIIIILHITSLAWSLLQVFRVTITTFIFMLCTSRNNNICVGIYNVCIENPCLFAHSSYKHIVYIYIPIK